MEIPCRGGWDTPGFFLGGSCYTLTFEHQYTVHTQTRRGRRSKIFAEMELGTWLGDKCQEFLGASRPDADLGANDGAGVATGFSERNVTDYFIALAKRASSSDALFEQLQSQGLPSSSAARGFARASPPDSWPLWSTHPTPPHPTPPHRSAPHHTPARPRPPRARPDSTPAMPSLAQEGYTRKPHS